MCSQKKEKKNISDPLEHLWWSFQQRKHKETTVFKQTHPEKTFKYYITKFERSTVWKDQKVREFLNFSLYLKGAQPRFWLFAGSFFLLLEGTITNITVKW